MTNRTDNGRRSHAIVRIMKIVVPAAITVGLCYVLFTGVDFNTMIGVIRRDCNFWWIGLALLVSILSHVVRAMRWKIQLNALRIYPPLFWIILSIFGTYAVNLVFPRLGEIWRTGYIATRQKAPFTTVFGSMVADRLADTVTVLTLSLITFLAAAPALIAFLTRYPEVYQGILDIVASPWIWAIVIAIAISLWWFLAMRTTNSIVCFCLSSIAMGIPSNGGIGPWQIAVIFALTVYAPAAMTATAAETFRLNATAFANLVLGMQTLLLIVLGLFTFAAIALHNRTTKKKSVI